ncbi:Signal peptidase I [Roseovarius sp. THAF8]|uniref:signal peptidase I n=1 Tax=Roseovarius sp. THAF8 TaxID=2587846 RepID=UPI001267FDF9|nr:signal peptidase I [Roseovarius sp. THAF8]QFT96640.1 Signal peptidase I [Roseovarius sp. THAF8]
MIRLAALLILLAVPAAAQPVCVCLKCLTGPFDSYWAPAGSMKPTILPGQCFISRTDVTPADLVPGAVITFRHPVTGKAFFKRIVATAGQTVQMRSGRLFINGAPVPTEESGPFTEPNIPQGPDGARPRCSNAPVADGADCLKEMRTETLGGTAHYILDIGPGRLDDTQVFTVPAGHLFVLGDNRDNSIDSRVPQAVGGLGFIPVENVTGILEEVRP